MTKIIRKRNKLGQFTKASPWENVAFIKKATSVLLMTLLLVGFLGIKETKSYYNDIESSTGNSFVAGALDFTISDSGFTPVENSLNLEPGMTTSKTIGMALEPESNPIKYTIKTTNITGDTPFCNALDLNAGPTGNQTSGDLVNFASSPTTTLGNWQYDLSLPTGSSFYNSVCSFDFEYNGRQTAPHNEYATGGYYDIETASNKIYSSGFRINKVYYDVDSAHGAEGTNEWVEVYNQAPVALDISGWQICDNTSCDTIPVSTPLIPAHGFGLITNSATTWSYWDIPSDVVKIALENDIGNGLADGGDSLILKRPTDGVIIDQMNWQTNTDVWNPGSVDVAEGNMLGRVPNGHDTNQASDFVELKPPTVAMVNPVGGEVWYVGNTYNIQWTAHTNNGSSTDADLKISLWYSGDSGATWAQFASNLSNTSSTGSYSWTLPLFIGSYYVPSHISRIRAIAVGPENFMVQAVGSSLDFCPPINYDALSPEDQARVDQMVLDGLIPASEVIKGMLTVEVPVAPAVDEPVINPDEVIQPEVTEVVEGIDPVVDEVITEDTTPEGGETVPEVVVEIPPVIEPEEIVTKVLEVIEALISEVIEPVESVEPEESPLPATLPEEIPPASPDEVVEVVE